MHAFDEDDINFEKFKKKSFNFKVPGYFGRKKAHSCSHKKRYSRIEQAKWFISRCQPNQRYYFCEICNGYHLTKNSIDWLVKKAELAN